MSQELAAAHVTLGVKTEGMAEATRFTQQLSSAQKTLTDTANSTSASIQLMRTELQEAVGALEHVLQAEQNMDAMLKGLGSSMKTLDGDIKRVTTDVTAQQAKVAALQKEWQAIGKSQMPLKEQIAARKVISDQLKIEQQALNKLTEQYVLLNQVQAARAEIPRAQLEHAAAVEKLDGSLQKAAQSQAMMTKQAGLNRTAITGLASAFLTGNVGSALLVQGAMSLVGSLGAVAAVAAVALTALVKLFGVISRIAGEMVKASDALNQINPKFIVMAKNIGTIQGMSLAQLANDLNVISNRLDSFGANTRFTDEIVQMGEALSLLAPGKGDAAKVINDLGRAFESLNFDSLRDTGIAVSELHAQLDRLREQGAGQAELAAFAEDFVRNALAAADASGQLADTFEREASGIGKMKEELSRFWERISGLKVVRDLVADFAANLRGLVPLLKMVALIIGGAIVGALIVVNGFLTMFLNIVKTVLRVIERLPGGQAFGDLANQIEDAQEAVKGFKLDLGDSNIEMQNFEQTTADVVDRFQELRDTVSGGFSIIGSLQGLTTAWDAMNEEMSGRSAFDAFQALDQVMGQVAEHGIGALFKVRDAAKAAFEQGFIPQDQYDKLVEGFRLIEAAATPISLEVGRVQSAFDDNKTAAEGAADALSGGLYPSISNIGAIADTAAGQVAGLTGQLHGLASAAALDYSFSVGVAGVQVPVMNRGGGPNQRGGLGGPRVPPQGRVGTVNQRVVGANAGDRGAFSTGSNAQDAIDALADFMRQSKGGAKGGGGGGGNKLATIDEIRELMRQVNRAILIGIRGGVAFSTAGNSIPLGFGAEFLNTKGGTLIQTVNIRGVWDFADPAAKRQIIKELEESIRMLKREK